jgi:hypothetical protein
MVLRVPSLLRGVHREDRERAGFLLDSTVCRDDEDGV